MGFGLRQQISPLGAALGSGAGRALGSVVDYPRQAVAGVLTAGPERALSWLPAALGLGAGGLAAMTGLAAPLAAPLGAGVAGLSQAVLSNLAPDSFGAASTGDVLRRYGLPDNAAAEVIASMAMDPMTWAGGFAGARPGQAASAARGLAADAGALLPGGLGGAALAGPSEARLLRAMAVPEGLAPAAGAAGADDIARFLDDPLGRRMQKTLAISENTLEGLQGPVLRRMGHLESTRPRLTPGPEGLMFDRATMAPRGAAAAPLDEDPLAIAFSGRPVMGEMPNPGFVPGMQGGMPAAALAENYARQLAAAQAMPGTSPMLPAAPALAAAAPRQPFQADLLEGQLASMMGYTDEVRAAFPPVPLGAGATPYKLVNPEVQAMLDALGYPFPPSRGALAPWMQVRGGRVMPSVGVPMPALPADPAAWLRQPY
jgi:hypothetical protein